MKYTGWRIALWSMVDLKLAGPVISQIVIPYGIHRDGLLYAAMGDHLTL